MTSDAATPAAEPKVFVGKISPNSTTESLTTAFSRVGPVVNVAIHTQRGRNHAKYAYVTFGEQAHADKAVAELNNASVDDASISVEAPRPRSTGPRTRRPRAPATEGSAEGAAEGAVRRRRRAPREEGDAAAGEAAPKPRAQRAPRTEVAAADGAAAGESRPPRGTGSRRGGRGGRAPRSTEEPRPASTRRPRPTRAELEARPDSDADLFVANLTYSVTDDALLEFFKANGAISAKVASFRGRSKGYGFVHFEKADGAKAASAKDGQELAGRNIVVRYAKVRPEPAAAAENN